MSLIRWFTALATVALLSGSACTVVHSDRPMGSAPYVSWPGPTYGQPEDLNGFWALSGPAPLGAHAQILLAIFDPATNRFRVGHPSNAGLYEKLVATTEVEIRIHKPAPEGYIHWLFFSEEDQASPGTYLWALARQYDADTFVLWYADRSAAFEAMVRDGRLRGKVVPTREARSGIVPNVQQRVILQQLDEAALDFIIDHRFELFALDAPVLLTRIRRLPRFPNDELPRLERPPSARAPAASAP